MSKYNVRTSCQNWKGDEAGFYSIVKEYLDVVYCATNIADAFEVASTTVLRWSNGVAKPRPVIQKLVVDWIAKEMAK
jgi:hypothetical protein